METFLAGIVFTLFILLVGFCIFKLVRRELKARLFRKNLKVGDKIRIYPTQTQIYFYPSKKTSVVGVVTKINNENIKTVEMTITTTLDKVYDF